jgi:ubiquinone/menaquinone biosynthesis C-methylase UbiE
MQVNTTYEPFSQQPEYIKVNNEFLQSLPLNSINRVLDLACGTGTLAEILLAIRPEVGIVGIDISATSLDIGRRHFMELGLLAQNQAELDQRIAEQRGGVLFVEGSADILPFEFDSFDLVMMGNSIHMLPDKDKLLSAIHRVLKPEGLFAFNSAFFVGTYPEGTEYVYTEWIKSALGYITEQDEALRKAGKPGITRKRGQVKKAFNKGWMTADQWLSLLQQNSFRVQHSGFRTMLWTQESFETVGAYSGFAEVMMSGYPAEVASQSLQEGAKKAFSACGVSAIPRYWLEIAARKD